jgi:hypothetical protein
MLTKRLKTTLMIPALALCAGIALMQLGGCSGEMPFEPERGSDSQAYMSAPDWTSDSEQQGKTEWGHQWADVGSESGELAPSDATSPVPDADGDDFSIYIEDLPHFVQDTASMYDPEMADSNWTAHYNVTPDNEVERQFGPYHLKFKKGCVETPVPITMTIPDPTQMVVEFSPHGLVFDGHIYFTVDLSGTALATDGSTLENDDVVMLWMNESTGRWEEIADGDFDANNLEYKAKLYHFSRYALARVR